MTMLERAAAAVAAVRKADDAAWGLPIVEERYSPPLTMDRRVVRAVLAAIREFSPELSRIEHLDDYLDGYRLPFVWERCIDAILAEGKTA